jgi:2-octaprenyl-6-methoxyphenol hydroxylase
MTFNIEHKNPHNNTAIERFSKNGPFAILPMHNQHQSSIVWTVPADENKYYNSLQDEEFLEFLKPKISDFLGSAKLISHRISYPLSLIYIKDYYQGNVVFLGDAAHGMHPIAGQGFNQGVKDSISLSHLIKEAYSLGLTINQDVLEQYQQERLPDNMQMITATDSINSIFAFDNSIIKYGRRIGISLVDKIKPLKEFFIKKAMGQF